MATRYTKYAKLLESVDSRNYNYYVVDLDYMVLFRFLLSLYIMT